MPDGLQPDPDMAWWDSWMDARPGPAVSFDRVVNEIAGFGSVATEAMAISETADQGMAAVRAAIWGDSPPPPAGEARWAPQPGSSEPVTTVVDSQKGAIWFLRRDGYPYGMLSGYEFADLPGLMASGKLLAVDDATIETLQPRAVRRTVRLVRAALAEASVSAIEDFEPFSATVRKGFRGRRRVRLFVDLDETLLRRVE